MLIPFILTRHALQGQHMRLADKLACWPSGSWVGNNRSWPRHLLTEATPRQLLQLDEKSCSKKHLRPDALGMELMSDELEQRLRDKIRLSAEFIP